MKPRNNPATDAPHETKFRKNVESIRRMTINKGRTKPNSIRVKPKLRRRRGLFMMADITNKPQNDSARVQNPMVLFHRINQPSFWNTADGSDSLWAGSPS
jgi:hypothetical protein